MITIGTLITPKLYSIYSLRVCVFEVLYKIQWLEIDLTAVQNKAKN